MTGNSTGEAIKRRRTERNLTQADLAKLVGITRTQIGRYERGEQLPSIVGFMKICEVMEITVTDIFGL